MLHDVLLWIGLFNLLGLVLIFGQVRKVSQKEEKSNLSNRSSPPLEMGQDLEGLGHIASLGALDLKYPVFLGGPSIDGHHARVLLQKVLELKPRVILELGSGTSTVLISKAMQRIGIEEYEHIAVDHIKYFLELTRENVSLNGLVDKVRFEHCPLVKMSSDQGEWYSRIPEIIEGKVELLIVDGPPAYEEGKESSRYPALPQVYPYLADRCVVILDDANRLGERAVLDKWRKQYPEFEIERVKGGKGVVLLKRGLEY